MEFIPIRSVFGKSTYFVATPTAFSNGKDKDAEKKEVERDHLYKKVGQLQIEVDWLKKRPAIWDERLRESQMHRGQK
jgi:hypothetical protein